MPADPGDKIDTIPMTLHPGTRLGPYEIVAALGAGGMGEVYRARDTRLQRDVAVKVLPERLAGSADALARFGREAKAVAALSHPNILSLFDFGEADGTAYAVTELLKGDTLRERLAGERLSERKTVEIAASIAEGLAAAHAAGIVHRDLKPENVFLTTDGRVKILDFGLARVDAPDDASDVTSAPTTPPPTDPAIVMGTAGYISPEQVRGKPADARSDIFAFGAVLYEMLTGERAFRGATAGESLAAILRDEPPEASRSAPGVSASMDRLVARCLEKNPDERFQSARDLAYALRELSGSSAVSRPTLPPPSPRRRVVPGAVVAALVGLLAFGAGWLLRPAFARPSPPPIDRVTRLTFGPGRNFGAAISPDGKWFAYLSDAGGQTDVWVRFVAGGEAVNLTAKSGLAVEVRADMGGLDISPDGSLIAFGAAPSRDSSITDFTTWVVPAPLGGVPRRLVKRGMGARWSPDGKRIAYISPGGGGGDALFTSDADGGNEKELLTALHVHVPAWSSDGRFLYFLQCVTSFNRAPAELWRMPSDGGAPERVVATSRRAIYAEPLMENRGVVFSADPDSAEMALWWLGAPRGVATRITTGLGEYELPRVSRDGRSIVATLTDLKQTLTSMRVDESPASLRDLTGGESGDYDPDLSASGDRLVWSSARSGNRNLWIGAPDTSGARPLTSGNFLDDRPAFSPDGRQVAFISARSGGRGVWLVPAEGGVPRRIYPEEVVDRPSWSPDGKEILVGTHVQGVGALIRVSVEDGRATPLKTPTAALEPAWNPKEPLIAYLIQVPASPEPKPTRNRLAFVDLEGNPRFSELPPSPTFQNGYLRWSPDGRRLLVLRQSLMFPQEAYIVDPWSSQPYRLLYRAVPGIEIRGATWSPDGSTITLGLERPKSDIVLLATH